MTVKEARKLLGKEYEKLTDEQVAELINQTHELAKLALEVARNKVVKANTHESNT